MNCPDVEFFLQNEAKKNIFHWSQQTPKLFSAAQELIKYVFTLPYSMLLSWEADQQPDYIHFASLLSLGGNTEKRNTIQLQDFIPPDHMLTEKDN